MDSEAFRPTAAGGNPFAQPALLAVRAPFDVVRHQYAASVRAGLAPCSLLHAARVEQGLATTERMLLGPLARTR